MMSMTFKFWGVRGSRPTHKKTVLKYGGNSTSLEFFVKNSNFHLFIDGGTGLAHRGMELGEQPEKSKFYFLMTHTHWDHILGLPFFEPLYSAKNEVNFFSSTTSKSTFNDLFWRLQRRSHSSVPVEKFKTSNAKFHVVEPGQTFDIENCVKVKTFQLNHQGVTLAYRIEHGVDSMTMITDNAPIEDGNYLGEGMHEKAQKDQQNPKRFEEAFNASLVEFLKGCHTVVFDTHFDELSLKPDWGHSTPMRALSFCIKAGVKRLILFHHAPEDSDTEVDAKVQSIKTEALKHNIEVVAATEGSEWTLR